MPVDRSQGQIEILLVEDNPGDVRITQEALKEGGLPHRLHVLSNGSEVMAYLRREGTNIQKRLPDVVLLDLNLPGMGGSEVLAAIKNDPELRQVPVVILTASKAEEDLFKSYNLNATFYITKPIDFDYFNDVIRTVIKHRGSLSVFAALALGRSRMGGMDPQGESPPSESHK